MLKPKAHVADATALTVSAALSQMTGRLRRANVDSPAKEARLLLCAATGRTRKDLIAEPSAEVVQGDWARATSFVNRRCRHEPVSRILGARAFYGRTFQISDATLDPRPESETAVSCVLRYVQKQGLADAPLRILDVGTGSGALLVTLLLELPNATGLGTDISRSALAIAAQNAARFGLGARAEFSCQKGLESNSQVFDILVSNPPYIAHHEMRSLPLEVADFDPHIALDGGADGLDFYRSFAPHLKHCVPHGLVALEVGHTQADAVIAILKTAMTRHFDDRFYVCNDLAGHRRCVAIETHS